MVAVNLPEVIAFLQKAYPEPWPGCLHIEVYDLTIDTTGKKRKRRIWAKEFYGVQEIASLVPQALDTFARQGFHFFFSCGMVIPGSKTLKIEAISHIKVLWADIDNIDASILATRLQSLPIYPTGIVKSGHGYHLYWDLGEYHAVDEALELASKKVHAWVGGDTTWALNRMLRLPGTWNCKVPNDPVKCEVIHWRDEAYVALEDILASGITYCEIRLPDDLKDRYILRGEGAGPKEDRSTRDFLVIKELIRANHTYEEIYQIFTNPGFGCSDKVLERKDPESYIKQTYDAARTEVSEREGGGIYDDGHYIYRRSVGRSGTSTLECISNFCLRPVRFIDIPDERIELLEVRVILERKEFTRTLFASNFLSWRDFVQAIEVPGLVWLGNEANWTAYMAYTNSQEIYVEEGTDVIGWHHTDFVLQDESLFGPGKTYVNTGKVPPILHLYRENDVDLAALVKAALAIHRPEITYPTLGWILAAAFAPQVRDYTRGEFPLLCLHGDRGTGKTTILKAYLEALCGVTSEYSLLSSIPLIRRALAGTNCVPVWIDEYTANFREAGSQKVDALFRLSYTGGSAPVLAMKRRAGVNPAPESRLTAPVVLTTMTGIEDEALQDRTYIVRMMPFPNEVQGTKLLDFLYTTPRGAVLYQWLQQPWREWVMAIREIGKLLPGTVTARQRIAFAVPAAALEFAGTLWGFEGDRKQSVELWTNNQESVAKESNFDILDRALAWAIHHRLIILDQEFTQNREGRYVFWQATTINVMVKVFQELQIPCPATKKFIMSILEDAKHTGRVLATNHGAQIGSKIHKSFILDPVSFPEITEAWPQC